MSTGVDANLTALGGRLRPVTDGIARTWGPRRPVDVAAALSVHQRGPYDPSLQIDGGAIWRTCRPDGAPATVRVVARPSNAQVEATAWGPGADAALEAMPSWLGADDDPHGFQPQHPLVARAQKLAPGLVIGRTGLVMEALVPAVLEQKVSGVEAYRAWGALLRKYGEPAPGPAPDGMRVPPGGHDWAAIPSWAWHRLGVGPERSRTIVRAARLARQLDALGATDSSSADRALRSVSGIGPWTSAEVRQRTHGDPDAVSVGDANLPHAVAYALAGERRASDERMLELLEPYAGHRHRACMYIVRHGPRPPRRAPRARIRDYRSF